MSSRTSIPKGKKPHEPSSPSRKPRTPSRPTATTRTVSGRSKKTRLPPSRARASILADCPKRAAEPSIPELVNEPLNRVLLLDHNCWLLQWPKNICNLPVWEEMNLIISIDYGRNVFNVLKNRWGETVNNLPLDCLGTFLYHPEITNSRELNLARINHNNSFATRKPEQ